MDEQNNDKQPNRSKNDYLKMTRSVLLNHLETETKKSKGEPPANKIADFFTKRVWSWFYYYISSRFGKNYPYQTYTDADKGIYPLKPEAGKDRVSIAITADWATDTNESFDVATKMISHEPDYTIHMGDTYYVGAPHEIELNFTMPGSPWVRGSKGSFAVLGNHEMYARGVAFFNRLLPSLGLRDEDGKYMGQKAGFFCLENEYWRILGLDTGYHSIGNIPLIELIPGFGSDCHFDEKLVDWLSDSLKLNDKNDKRGLLILTHHQYITAFKGEGEYPAPANQLAKLIGKDRPVVWLWGHEHKFSVFEKAQVGDGITAYGRCIGHGGMPIELNVNTFNRSEGAKGNSKLVMVDTRTKTGTESYPLGYNGYVVVSVKDKELEVAYFDTDGKLFSESWEANLESGNIKGSIDVPVSSRLKTVDGKAWEDAVK
ncbi:MAG TPA: metallophosphoesterase [Mucilaginibacter sp.]|jgi:hypothetical protein